MVSKPLLIAALLVSNVLQTTLPLVNAQQMCQADGVALCASNNTNCVSYGSSETCGQCLDGYIQRRDACVSIDSLDLQSYLDFVEDYKPIFSKGSETDSQRFGMLKTVSQYVSQHNSQFPPPDFILGLNKFAVDTIDEIKSRLGFIPSNSSGTDYPPFEPSVANVPNGSGVNWVTRGAVTSVKDQGRCGCCWAVSMAGAIEGAAAIDSNLTYLQSVSFQQFISCDDQNAGCNGGDTVLAMDYALNNPFGGMTTLNEYPYTDEAGTTTESCAVSGQRLAIDLGNDGRIVTSFSNSDSFASRMTIMKSALLERPISIIMRAMCDTLSLYKAGVLTSDGDCACSSLDCLDHAVLLVGYDDSADIPYWLIKNSWGPDWGEDGYFRVSQVNPTGATDSWGLFGVLAQGVVPLNAYNVTGEVPDEPQTTNSLETWQIVVVAAVGAAVLACAVIFVLKCLGTVSISVFTVFKSVTHNIADAHPLFVARLVLSQCCCSGK